MPHKDKEANRIYQREWTRRRRDAWIQSQGGKCVECGSTEELEIDHVDPATKSFNIGPNWNRSMAVLEKELAKCQVLCHSCHEAKSLREMKTEPSAHGSEWMYTHHKCRCDICRQGRRERKAAKKLRLQEA